MSSSCCVLVHCVLFLSSWDLQLHFSCNDRGALCCFWKRGGWVCTQCIENWRPGGSFARSVVITVAVRLSLGAVVPGGFQNQALVPTEVLRISCVVRRHPATWLVSCSLRGTVGELLLVPVRRFEWLILLNLVPISVRFRFRNCVLIIGMLVVFWFRLNGKYLVMISGLRVLWFIFVLSIYFTF